MEIIRKREAVQKVIEPLDQGSSKHIVVLEDDIVSVMTIGIFQVLDCWWFLHSISDCMVIIFTVPIASISILYHIITPFPSIVRNHAQWLEQSHDPHKNKVICVLVRIQKTLHLHDHCMTPPNKSANNLMPTTMVKLTNWHGYQKLRHTIINKEHQN
jgi:hypothetical protein